MATSHDDVSELETAHNKVNPLVDHSDDGDTTAAATAPATRRKDSSAPSDPEEADEDDEDRTVQQPVDPKVRSAARNAALALGDKAVHPLPNAVSAPPAPPRITSKKMTAVGLGPVRSEPTAQPSAPPAPPPTPMSASPPATPSAPTLKDPKPPALTAPSSPLASQADVADDSITATAPAPRISVNGASLPITVPSVVKITELGDEPLDETEVRTVVTGATDDTLESTAEPTSSSPAPTDPTNHAQGKMAETLESAVPPPTTEADEPDDSVTAQAPSPLSNGRLPEHEDEPRTAPPMLAPKLATRPPIPAAGRRPDIPPPPPVPMSARTGPHAPLAPAHDEYEADESVTTRGPAVGEHEFADDSVTAQAPVTRSSPNGPVALATPPTFEETDGTTKRVPKGGQPAKPGSPEELQSVTSEAPAGHLSNMLRVIASGGAGADHSNEDGVEDEGDPDDDSEENRTAVMLNAPVKPPPAAGAPPPAAVSSRPRFPAAIPTTGGGGRRVAAIADLRADFRESSSDSGLRVARAEEPSGDHASMNALLAGTPAEQQHRVGSEPHQRGSGVSEKNASANPFAKTQQAFATPGPRSRSRSEQVSVHARSHDSPEDFAASIKKPRYGLIVAAVAVLSFAIPLILFLWLHSGSPELTPREKAEVNPDIVKPDPPRPKAPASARAAIAASASAAARRNDALLKRH